MSKHILLVEDDTEISDLLSTLLSKEGFAVSQTYDGEQGEQAALSQDFDVIILDILLPRKNGLEVLRDIRGKLKTPIIMLTAKGEDIDRILGFEIGADDYLPKPFNPRELIARINALLRRVEMDSSTSAPTKDIVQGNLQVKTRSREVSIDDQVIDLTTTEYEVLVALLSKQNEIVSKADLTELALGRKLSFYDRAIDMHVSNLRKKLCGQTIKTVRGVGYMFQAQDNT